MDKTSSAKLTMTAAFSKLQRGLYLKLSEPKLHRTEIFLAENAGKIQCPTSTPGRTSRTTGPLGNQLPFSETLIMPCSHASPITSPSIHLRSSIVQGLGPLCQITLRSPSTAHEWQSSPTPEYCRSLPIVNRDPTKPNCGKQGFPILKSSIS